MPRYITPTQARKDFFTLLQKARVAGHFVRISLQGEGSNVVLMSEDELEGWQETMEIMADTKLLKDIRDARQEFASGKKGMTLDAIAAEHALSL